MPAIVTKSMQDAAQRIHSLLDQHFHSALQPAIDAETAPLKEEIENHRVLVNETVEKARLDMADAVKALSDKENELVGARARIVEDENQIGQLNQILSERDAEIADLKEEAKTNVLHILTIGEEYQKKAARVTELEGLLAKANQAVSGAEADKSDA